MRYAQQLRSMFPNVSLNAEDMFLLEPFQIEYLPERAPRREFSALLSTNPMVRRYLIAACPSIESFTDGLDLEFKSTVDDDNIARDCDEAVWEIADLLVYNKHPEMYDRIVDFGWEIDEILDPASITDSTVLDVGAGSGRLAFLMAQHARAVYAVEPVGSFRRFIREKADRDGVSNLYVVDGFLNSLPFPDRTVDVLGTSHAIGWDLDRELLEIQRVLKSGGRAFHLMKNMSVNDDGKHAVLTSATWGYTCTKYPYDGGEKSRYLWVME